MFVVPRRAIHRTDRAADIGSAELESSGGYGDALRWQLHQRGIAVYRVGAKRCTTVPRSSPPSARSAKLNGHAFDVNRLVNLKVVAGA